jgi:bisphosphoglycerate-dependent phosphoglycerate mutase
MDVKALELATGVPMIYTLRADSTVASKDVVACANPSSTPAASK